MKERVDWLTKLEGLEVLASAQLDPGVAESQGLWPTVSSIHEHWESIPLDR